MPFQRFFALAAFAFASLASTSAFAHAKLQSSDPPAGSTLDSAPKHIRLKFNEALEPAFSKIKVMGPGNSAIAVAATSVDKADPTVMSTALPPLPAGEYHIQWTAVSHDGHKMKGDVPFRVK